MSEVKKCIVVLKIIYSKNSKLLFLNRQLNQRPNLINSILNHQLNLIDSARVHHNRLKREKQAFHVYILYNEY